MPESRSERRSPRRPSVIASGRYRHMEWDEFPFYPHSGSSPHIQICWWEMTSAGMTASRRMAQREAISGRGPLHHTSVKQIILTDDSHLCSSGPWRMFVIGCRQNQKGSRGRVWEGLCAEFGDLKAACSGPEPLFSTWGPCQWWASVLAWSLNATIKELSSLSYQECSNLLNILIRPHLTCYCISLMYKDKKRLHEWGWILPFFQRLLVSKLGFETFFYKKRVVLA